MTRRHAFRRRRLSFALIALTGGSVTTVAPAQFSETVDVIHEWIGEAPNDRMGRVVRVIGDVDGDGVGDIAIGAPNRAEGGVQAGKVYIRSGADGSLIRSHVGAPNDNLGNEIAGVGDLNDDGVPDYVVGAPSGLAAPPVGPGRAFLYSGCDGTVIRMWTGEADGDRFGRIVSGGGNALTGGVGDIDDDKVPDVLIGAPSHDTFASEAGRVYVYSGANLAETIHVVDGFLVDEQFGQAIGGLGDLDDDGFGDFVVGAHQGATGPGRAYVLSGADASLLLPRLDPDATGSAFGLFFASGPGDVDNDGTPDVFVTDIGDVSSGASTGKAYVFSGVDGSRLLDWTGSTAGEGLGVGRGCGDVDFDGHADLLISAFSSSREVPNGGRSFVFAGQDGRLLRKITSTTSGDYFGWSGTGLGDLNGDGSIDFAISAALSPVGGFQAGRVFVIGGDIFPCVADLDGDGVVGFADVLAILAAWGPCPDCPEDLDDDDAVGFSDILIALSVWGPCP